jgi:hypothetical protein
MRHHSQYNADSHHPAQSCIFNIQAQASVSAAHTQVHPTLQAMSSAHEETLSFAQRCFVKIDKLFRAPQRTCELKPVVESVKPSEQPVLTADSNSECSHERTSSITSELGSPETPSASAETSCNAHESALVNPAVPPRPVRPPPPPPRTCSLKTAQAAPDTIPLQATAPVVKAKKPRPNLLPTGFVLQPTVASSLAMRRKFRGCELV